MNTGKSAIVFIVGLAVFMGVAWIMFVLSPLHSIAKPLTFSEQTVIVFPFVLVLFFVVRPLVGYWLDAVDTLADAPND